MSIAVDGQYDAPGDDNLNLNEEWVRFTNTGATPIDLVGLARRRRVELPPLQFDDLTLAPGASVTLFTGCGSDTESERYWCNEDSAVWNNSGDTVFLQDASGNKVVAETYRDEWSGAPTVRWETSVAPASRGGRSAGSRTSCRAR